MVQTLNFNRHSEKKALEIVKNSFIDTGFLVVTNHNISKELIESAYDESAKFFAQPQSLKDKYIYENSQNGYTSFGVEKGKDAKLADLKEFFHICALYDPLNTSDLYTKKNRTKEMALSSCKKLYEELFGLSYILLKMCSTILNEQSHTSLANSICSGPSVLRLLHYPAIDTPTDAVRAAAHEDINLITLLVASAQPGLELLDRDNNWVPVESKNNDIIVNVGDMLQNFTNGYFKSTTHRVMNTAIDKPRYSMPFFAHPRGNTNLAPRQNCIDLTGGEAKYPKITAEEYLTERLREIGLIK